MAAPLVENENFYKDLDPIFDEINIKGVKIDKELKKKYVNIILEVVKFVIGELKANNEVFNQLFSTLDYVGSYYDGLRVAKPTEFDLNLIMKIPFYYRKVLIENNNVAAGFVKVKISEPIYRNHLSERVIGTINKWCNDDGYLLENRVRQWMESILTCWLGHGPKPIPVPSGEIVMLRVRKSGPAFTLNINIESDVIDVDLVFTIRFPESMRPPSPIRWSNELAASWVIVPKPTNDPHFWRVSFNNSERRLMENQYKLKLINRFLKALRDSQLWPIPSYFIKSLFLWEAHECNISNKTKFWEQRQGYLFILMLNKLSTKLNEYKLPYYWHKRMNLFINRLNEHHAKNMANHMRGIISRINVLITKKDKEGLKRYILALFKIPEC